MTTRFVGIIIAAALVVASPAPGEPATFQCPSGDTTCLIAAINTANANGEVNTIGLAAGTYTLTAVDNVNADGPNGLPSITSPLTITGAGQDNTLIQREVSAPAFRLIHVGPTGLVRLGALTLTGGRATPAQGGGGALTRGALTVNDSTIRNNDGGGLSNFGTVVIAASMLANNRGDADSSYGGLSNRGTAMIINSIVANNVSGMGAGGVVNGGTLSLLNSSIESNFGAGGGGGLFHGSGSLMVLNSTIANNGADAGGAGVLMMSGTATIVNSTIAVNRTCAGCSGGGIAILGGTMTVDSSTIADNVARLNGVGGLSNVRSGTGTVSIQNTIIANNREGDSKDCAGPVTSMDNNLLGDPTGCTITLLPFDLTGDAGLGPFTDDGTPGHGHVPLLAGSPAIDAADDAACLPTDQLGQSRPDPCDIGAVEFQGPH